MFCPMSEATAKSPEALRDLYDIHNRIAYQDALSEREEDAGTVRYLWPAEKKGAVLYSPGDADDADARIDRQIARFRELGYEMEWKHFSHDQPVDMKDRLRRKGLAEEEPEAVMVLEIERASPALLRSPSHDVRKVTTPGGYRDADAVNQAVWGDGPDQVTRHHWPRYQADPDGLSLYVAYVDGKPASFGRLELPRNSPFAGLWGGSTVAEHRGKGLYTALVAARLREAVTRGRRYLTVDATQGTSMPILERLGFVTIAYATAFIRPALG